MKLLILNLQHSLINVYIFREIIDNLKDQDCKENIDKMIFHLLEASDEKERQEYYDLLLTSEL